MTNPRTVVLDNEAVQALVDASHLKHRRALAVVEATAARNRSRAGAVRLVVPTSVRVEAGWDRHSPHASVVNRLRVEDAPLDSTAADLAVAIRCALYISVVDAHIGAVLASSAAPHSVVTSDAHDLRRIAGHLDIKVNIVTI